MTADEEQVRLIEAYLCDLWTPPRTGPILTLPRYPTEHAAWGGWRWVTLLDHQRIRRSDYTTVKELIRSA